MSNKILCILLGVERSSALLFENFLPVLLQQTQIAAFQDVRNGLVPADAHTGPTDCSGSSDEGYASLLPSRKARFLQDHSPSDSRFIGRQSRPL